MLNIVLSVSNFKGNCPPIIPGLISGNLASYSSYGRISEKLSFFLTTQFLARTVGFEPTCIQLAFSGLEDQRHTCVLVAEHKGIEPSGLLTTGTVFKTDYPPLGAMLQTLNR